MTRIVIEQIAGETAHLRALLDELDQLHQLRDSRFATPDRLTGGDPQVVRLVAAQRDRHVGFLTGIPRLGHIALIGVVHEGAGIGSALLASFLARARAAGAADATIVLDSDPQGRWRRRRFAEARGFTASEGSVLHFHRHIQP